MSGPGIEGTVDTEIPPEELSEPVGPDDWYAVDPTDDPGSNDGPVRGANGTSEATLGALAVRQNRLVAGVAIMVLLAGTLAFLVWRRRRRAQEPATESDAPSLARGISKVIDRQMSASVADIAEGREDRPGDTSLASPTQAKPQATDAAAGDTDASAAAHAVAEPAPPIDDRPAARIDVDLEIVGATRSLMMLTLDFRVEIANRSDRAVRELAITGKLSSARRDGTHAAPVAAGQSIGEIARLGPRQSRSISAQLQLPLSQVEPIRQANRPLLIPLLHLTMGGKEIAAISHHYVIGSPSLAGSGRVHPILLDGTPGGLSGLQAQLINSFDASAQAKTI